MAFIVEVISLECRAGYILKYVEQITVGAIEARGSFAAGIVRCVASKNVAVEFPIEGVASGQLACGIILHVRVPRTLQKR